MEEEEGGQAVKPLRAEFPHAALDKNKPHSSLMYNRNLKGTTLWSVKGYKGTALIWCSHVAQGSIESRTRLTLRCFPPQTVYFVNELISILHRKNKIKPWRGTQMNTRSVVTQIFTSKYVLMESVNEALMSTKLKMFLKTHITNQNNIHLHLHTASFFPWKSQAAFQKRTNYSQLWEKQWDMNFHMSDGGIKERFQFV